MQWYYVENDQQAGPVDEEAFNALIKAGRIQSATLVWREGMDEWRSWGEVSGIPVPSPFPSSPSLQDQSYGVPRVEYAGFWIRVLATIVDGAVKLGVLLVPVVLILARSPAMDFLHGVFSRNSAISVAKIEAFQEQMVPYAIVVGLLGILFELVYKTVMIGRFGATLGYMACRLRCVREDISAVSYGRAFGRFAAELPFQFLMNFIHLGVINYIFVAFDSEKRALHDMMCSTRVIRIP